MVELLLADSGRWLESLIEVDGTVSAIRRWAQQAPACLAEGPARQEPIPFIQSQQTWEPYTVVGVISPWNFPLMLTLIDAVPALAAGCTILAKPSEVTSRFVPLLREILAARTEPRIPDGRGIQRNTRRHAAGRRGACAQNA